MKKLLLTIFIITVIITFSSCSERINSFSLDPAVFEAVNFTAKAEDYEYKGTLSCSENIAEIVLSEPSELKEMKFIIDENGIKCCEKDIEILNYYLMRIIFRGVEHPNLSIGEIIAMV